MSSHHVLPILLLPQNQLDPLTPQTSNPQDSLRQQDWKIERMVRDNRALELQNTELRNQLLEVKTENLEVSEKIVLLDEEVGCCWSVERIPQIQPSAAGCNACQHEFSCDMLPWILRSAP